MDVKDMGTGGEAAIHDMQPNVIRTAKIANEAVDTTTIKAAIDMMACAEQRRGLSILTRHVCCLL
jgi:hypothetical protein